MNYTFYFYKNTRLIFTPNLRTIPVSEKDSLKFSIYEQIFAVI